MEKVILKGFPTHLCFHIKEGLAVQFNDFSIAYPFEDNNDE